MRILFATQSYPPEFSGGSTVYAIELANEMRCLGHVVDFVVGSYVEPADTYTVESVRGDASPTIYRLRLPDSPIRSDRLHRRQVFRALAEADLGRYDVLHFHSALNLGLGLFDWAKRRGMRIVMTAHDYAPFCSVVLLAKRFGQPFCARAGAIKCAVCTFVGHAKTRHVELPRIAARSVRRVARTRAVGSAQRSLVDHVIYVAPFVQRMFHRFGWQSVPGEVIQTTTHQPSSHRTTSEPHTPLRFGAIGSFRVGKGGATLVQAVKLLMRRGVAFELHVWGSVDTSDAMELSGGRWNDVVFMHGTYGRDELPGVLDAMDVFVSTSLNETYSLVALEAAAHRKVLLLPRHGATQELAAPLGDQFRYEPADARDLCDKMTWMASNPHDALRAATRLKSLPTYQSFVEKHVSTYRRVLEFTDEVGVG